MKIAVAAMGNTVSGHFGHCEDFLIFDTADGAVTGEERVPNPGHRPAFLPNFLADRGVEAIIAGGMGGGAVEIFNERNVEVIVGAQGDARAAVEAYLRGELESTGSIEIPAGKLVLTVNQNNNEWLLGQVQSLKAGDQVTIDHAVAVQGSENSILDGYGLTINARGSGGGSEMNDSALTVDPGLLSGIEGLNVNPQGSQPEA